MDAALALGPVRIECNVCGKYHDVALDASAITAAVGSKEWDGVRWLDCLAQRCALGLHWSQEKHERGHAQDLGEGVAGIVLR